MKKFVLFMLLILSCTVSFAGSVKKSGNASVLRENAVAQIVFDFNGSRWEEDEDFKAYCGNSYEERVRIAHDSFVNTFNNLSKGLKISDNTDGAKYKVVVKVQNFVQKMAMVGWGRFSIRIYANIEIQDISNGQTVCSFYAKGVSGGADYSQDERFNKSWGEVAKEILK